MAGRAGNRRTIRMGSTGPTRRRTVSDNVKGWLSFVGLTAKEMRGWEWTNVSIQIMEGQTSRMTSRTIERGAV